MPVEVAIWKLGEKVDRLSFEPMAKPTHPQTSLRSPTRHSPRGDGGVPPRDGPTQAVGLAVRLAWGSVRGAYNLSWPNRMRSVSSWAKSFTSKALRTVAKRRAYCLWPCSKIRGSERELMGPSPARR